MSPTEWKWLGTMDPTGLVDARLQLHWAAQVVASVGYTFIEAEPDYGHLSLYWLAGEQVLASRATRTNPGFRSALQLSTLTLLLLDQHDVTVASYALDGHTLDEGYAWLAHIIATYANTTQPLTRPEHELPFHPIAEGTPFSFDLPKAFVELSHWYDNAHNICRSVSEAQSHASPVRCWPHHFDMATLIQFDPDSDPEAARSIGVGLSPGDRSYAEPYWYVLPWPPPDAEFPALIGGGFWHTQDWIGAVLQATHLVKADDATAQYEQVRTFIQSGIAAGHTLPGLSD